MKKILATVAVAGALVSTASAADFTGARAELHAGWDKVAASDSGVSISKSGLVYGLGLGYDVAVGGAILGLEGNADLSSVKECVVYNSGVSNGAGGTFFGKACVNARRDLSALVRAGFAAGENTLLYAKAGYVNGRLSYDGNGANGDGVRAGAGVEYSFGKTYVKAEYHYTNYEAGVSRNQVLVGFGVRF